MVYEVAGLDTGVALQVGATTTDALRSWRALKTEKIILMGRSAHLAIPQFEKQDDCCQSVVETKDVDETSLT